jgi:hypothetical protein
MPFAGQAQHAKFQELLKEGKISQAKFDEWLAASPPLHTLPERVGDKPGTTRPSAVSPVVARGRKK